MDLELLLEETVLLDFALLMTVNSILLSMSLTTGSEEQRFYLNEILKENHKNN